MSCKTLDCIVEHWSSVEANVSEWNEWSAFEALAAVRMLFGEQQQK